MLGMMDLPVAALMVLAVAIWLFALIECIRTPADRVRFVPKLLWLLILLNGSVLAAVAWAYLGRKPIPNTTKGPIEKTEPFAQAR
ncbi:hypothetical protein ACIBVL_13815 [Streptomyces sp. NPDC049687]|uniref:hypothetical protein n=1 Tax=Streptomyces sp. NPDC049687 TaxID=3365596 RepID=UPI0037A4777D